MSGFWSCTKGIFSGASKIEPCKEICTQFLLLLLLGVYTCLPPKSMGTYRNGLIWVNALQIWWYRQVVKNPPLRLKPSIGNHLV